jgi:hypothetical protein
LSPPLRSHPHAIPSPRNQPAPPTRLRIPRRETSQHPRASLAAKAPACESRRRETSQHPTRTAARASPAGGTSAAPPAPRTTLACPQARTPAAAKTSATAPPTRRHASPRESMLLAHSLPRGQRPTHSLPLRRPDPTALHPRCLDPRFRRPPPVETATWNVGGRLREAAGGGWAGAEPASHVVRRAGAVPPRARGCRRGGRRRAVAITVASAGCGADGGAPRRWRSRREVVNWLPSLFSG